MARKASAPTAVPTLDTAEVFAAAPATVRKLVAAGNARFTFVRTLEVGTPISRKATAAERKAHGFDTTVSTEAAERGRKLRPLRSTPDDTFTHRGFRASTRALEVPAGTWVTTINGKRGQVWSEGYSPRSVWVALTDGTYAEHSVNGLEVLGSAAEDAPLWDDVPPAAPAADVTAPRVHALPIGPVLESHTLQAGDRAVIVTGDAPTIVVTLTRPATYGGWYFTEDGSRSGLEGVTGARYVRSLAWARTIAELSHIVAAEDARTAPQAPAAPTCADCGTPVGTVVTADGHELCTLRETADGWAIGTPHHCTGPRGPLEAMRATVRHTSRGITLVHLHCTPIGPVPAPLVAPAELEAPAPAAPADVEWTRYVEAPPEERAVRSTYVTAQRITTMRRQYRRLQAWRTACQLAHA